MRSSVRQVCLVIFLLLFAISSAPARVNADELAKATFAGGCFWCMQPPFDT